MKYYKLNWCAPRYSVLHLKLVHAGWEEEVCHLVDGEMVAEMLSPAVFVDVTEKINEYPRSYCPLH